KAFQDVPAMVDCFPGATLLEQRGNGIYRGRIQSRLGPFSASFEGEASVTQDESRKSGHVEGKGVDRRGGSRTKLILDYGLEPVGTDTRVTVVADVSLSGAIAQFGRTGLVTEAANILVGEFVARLEQKLSSGKPEEASAVKGADLQGLFLLMKSLLA